jgi:hypothetical protein
MAYVGAAAVIGGATIYASSQSSKAAKKASQAQAEGISDSNVAMLEAAGIQAEAAIYAAELGYEASIKGIEEMKRQYELDVERQMPWYESGKRALGTLEGMVKGGPPEVDYWGPWTGSPGEYEKSPYYDFLMRESVNALDRSAAAGGTLNSGQQQRAVMEYGKGLASTDYNNWLNQYNTERNQYYQDATWDMTTKNKKLADYYNSLTPYQSLAGVGQTTAANLGTMGANYAGNVANLLGQGADALGQGAVGAAGAMAGAQEFAAKNAMALGNINASGIMTQANINNNMVNQLANVAGNLWGNYANPNALNPGSSYWQSYNWNSNPGTTSYGSGNLQSGDYVIA